MLPDINKKCNKDMCITTCHKKMMQLTYRGRPVKPDFLLRVSEIWHFCIITEKRTGSDLKGHFQSTNELLHNTLWQLRHNKW